MRRFFNLIFLLLFIIDVLVETDLFSDALAASANSISKSKIDAAKKRKRRLSSSKDEKSTPTSPTSTAPLKFYQDTLESENAEPHEENDDDESKPKKTRASLSDEEVGSPKNVDEIQEPEEVVLEAKKVPGIGTGPDGPPGILKISSRKGTKKRLTWKVPEELEEVRYFELDETERCNVTKTSFMDMKTADRLKERQGWIMARKIASEDVMVERTNWAVLIEVENVPPHPMGKESVERRVQADRERTVLKALYFTRASIPDSPAEPEFEHVPMADPKVVPMEDVTGNPDSVNDFRSMPWPEPKGEASQAQQPPLQQQFAPFNNFPPPQTAAPMGTLTGAWATPMPFGGGMMQVPAQVAMMAPPFVAAPAFDPAPFAAMYGRPPNVMPMQQQQQQQGPPPRGDWNHRPNSDRYPNDRRHNDRRYNERDDRDRRNGGSGARGKNICFQFQKYGHCRLGDKCNYYHSR